MGTSTNGQICYGIMFEEDFDFPWGDAKYDGDIEEWWKEVSGYVNPHFNPWTEDGDYKEGVAHDDPRIQEYHDHRYDWAQNNPLPIEVVNYCSGDCPMYILAVPSTFESASCGYPTVINTRELVVKDEAEKDLIDFCKKHGIEVDDTSIGWWLSSLWC